MNHQGSFLTGFLTGQRLKLWQTGAAAAEGGVNFYDWAVASGADPNGPLISPQDYARYVAGINPRVFLNSDGTLTWSPTVDDIPPDTYAVFRSGYTGGYYNNYLYGFRVDSASGWSGGYANIASATLNADRRSWQFVYQLGEDSDPHDFMGLDCFYLTAAMDGTYNANGFPAIIGYGNLADGSQVNLSQNYGDAPAVMYAGRNYLIGRENNYDSVDEVDVRYYTSSQGSLSLRIRASALVDIYLPTFKIIPHATNSLTNVPRPGKLSGSPINEDAHTFTNPLTGETISYDSYVYDPQTRTYTLTLPDGNKMDVEFGDDGIKITQGLGGGEPDVQGAMYPAPVAEPVVEPPADTVFSRDAFLSGLAAGMASRGL